MKKLFVFVIALMLLVGCGDITDDDIKDDERVPSDDEAIEDAAENKYINFELIWDTKDIGGLIPASITSSLGTEIGIYTDFADYYLVTESGAVKLECKIHKASYGDLNLAHSIFRHGGEMIHAQGKIISDHEYIIEARVTGDMPQLFLADTKTDKLTPLLSNSAFGFSYNEYNELTSKWETIDWCSSFDVNPNKDKIVYFSNKGTDGENPIFEYGIWIYDLEDCKEYRLDTSMYKDVSSPMWVSDEKILFNYADEDGYPVYCVYNLGENTTCFEFSSVAMDTAVDSNVMVYSLSDLVEIIEFESGKLHSFEVGKLLSFYSPEVVSSDKTVAFADRDNDVYVFDLTIDTYKVYPTEFGKSKVSVGAVLENGDVLVNVWNEDLTQVDGVYKVK